MKVTLHINQLDNRGTGNAICKYAKFLKKGGHDVEVMTSDYGVHHSRPVSFLSLYNIPIKTYPHKDFSPAFLSNKCEVLYMLNDGRSKGYINTNARVCVHSVFENDPHGDRYAFVSSWLANHFGSDSYVPHIVENPFKYILSTRIARANLGLPKSSLIFGRHGGYHDFDIPFVKAAVEKVVNDNRHVMFIFANTEPFIQHPRVRFMKELTNDVDLWNFIYSCDAMLHARQRGETFGLSVAEFSVANKPIFTYGGSPEKAHMEVLKEKAIVYNDYENLVGMLNDFKVVNDSYDMYSKDYAPDTVMRRFEEVFLK